MLFYGLGYGHGWLPGGRRAGFYSEPYRGTVFTSEGNPINALAKILQWVSTWADYVF